MTAHCFYCLNKITKDGMCELHWDFYFKGLTNHQRMLEKARLRKERAEAVASIGVDNGDDPNRSDIELD